ncbi:MAG: hypothetical protein AAGA62_15300 [Bacteroidota bacterium]
MPIAGRSLDLSTQNSSSIKQFFTLLVLGILFFGSACEREFAGDRLFEVIYPVTEFNIPAGQPNFSTFVIAQPQVLTNFVDEISQANVTVADIDNVSGLRARVTSLSGEDFGEIERIELRVCTVGQSGGCDQFNLLFSVDDLFRRRQQTVNLNPGLRNFRELFVSSDLVRVELVITPGITTSQNIQARLEWSVQAVGNLE